MTAEGNSWFDTSNPPMAWGECTEPQSNNGIGSGAFQIWACKLNFEDDCLSSVGHYPSPFQLSSTAMSLPTSTTNFHDNWGPPSGHSPVDPNRSIFPPSIIAQDPETSNVRYGGYRSTVEEDYYTASASFADPQLVHAEAGARGSWQNARRAQNEPTTTIHNGTFIVGNGNNTVKHGESGVCPCMRIEPGTD
jgi:hypothetical protein